MKDEVFPPELRAQLIALLETTLAQLKSPMIERSFLAKVGHWLQRLGKKLGEEAGEKVAERLANNAGDRIIDLIESSVL
jgi:phosphoribosyl-ATP pyrophosphohydrolase